MFPGTWKFAVLAMLASAPAWAQIQPAIPSSGDASVSSQIQLGDSVVPLLGPWKFTLGDSPINPSTGKPLWSEPAFDDSQWETVDLTPKDGAIDPVSGLSGYVPGWTGKGHPGYWGYAWYRIRVKVETKPGVKLALLGPADVDDAYQAFNDGILLGSFGTFRSHRPIVYFSQPMMFPIEQKRRPKAGQWRNESACLSYSGWNPTH